MSLPRDAVGWCVVFDCGFTWSYSYAFTALIHVECHNSAKGPKSCLPKLAKRRLQPFDTWKSDEIFKFSFCSKRPNKVWYFGRYFTWNPKPRLENCCKIVIFCCYFPYFKLAVCILKVPSRAMAIIRVLQYIHTLQVETPIILQCMFVFVC